MKKIIFMLLAWLFVLVVSAQRELHIHHINIGNGDATLIGIFDVAQEKYVSKVLIDGGQLNGSNKLIPYIRKMVGTDAESRHFDDGMMTG